MSEEDPPGPDVAGPEEPPGEGTGSSWEGQQQPPHQERPAPPDAAHVEALLALASGIDRDGRGGGKTGDAHDQHQHQHHPPPHASGVGDDDGGSGRGTDHGAARGPSSLEGASPPPPGKRGRREWLAYRGTRHTRVGGDYQVATLPPLQGVATTATTEATTISTSTPVASANAGDGVTAGDEEMDEAHQG